MSDSNNFATDPLFIKDTISLLTELIQNKCVNPPGNEMRSIKTIQRVLHEHEIESQIFETAPDRGNLLARIKGTGKGPSLMFGPSHVDVVPVETPEVWIEDPFSGLVKDGFVWGRGAVDMLFIVASQVQTFINLHEEGFKPIGDLILLIVSDEEAGGKFGAEWMIKNHRELVEADYAITETGGIPIAPNKFSFAYGEKGVSQKRIIFKGSPGHGSLPYGSENAAIKMSEAVNRISKYKAPVTTKYLDHLADGIATGFIQRLMLTTPWLLPLTLKTLIKQQPSTAKSVHALSRMTFSPNLVKGGVKVNVIPEKAEIELDIRTLPGQNYDYVTSHLRKALGPMSDEVIIEDILRSDGNESPPSSDFVFAMEQAVKKELPSAELVPIILMAVSDGRFLRNIGADVYGFSLFEPETSLNQITDFIHGTNERISIKTLELTQKVYYNLAKDFLTPKKT